MVVPSFAISGKSVTFGIGLQLLINKLIMKAIEVKRSGNKITDWNDHLDTKYGNDGTVTRAAFVGKAQAFAIGELLKDARIKAKLTQQELAEKTGTKKSYISRIENGRADIQLSTLYKLIEQGLNRKLEVYIR